MRRLKPYSWCRVRYGSLRIAIATGNRSLGQWRCSPPTRPNRPGGVPGDLREVPSSPI